MERYRVTIDVAAWSHSSAYRVAAKMLTEDPSRWAKVEEVEWWSTVGTGTQSADGTIHLDPQLIADEATDTRGASDGE